jgi:Na+-driven multidrug efflux pump
MMILLAAALQIICGGTLGLGLGPIPQFGVRGVAAGALIAFAASIGVMSWYLFSGRARVVPKIVGLQVSWEMLADILKVGAISCFSPLQSVLSISIFTHFLARYGTEVLAGFGIGSRLEFMLTSLAFSFGIASVPMIGMAIGAERILRARRVALVAGVVSFVTVGVIATAIAIVPNVWVHIFTDDAGVRMTGRQYLSTVAPMYAFIGLAMSMYFSSQGAAKVVGPVLAQTARLVFIALGGAWLVSRDASAGDFFILAAMSMVLLGVLSALAVLMTRWGARREAVVPVQPVLSQAE